MGFVLNSIIFVLAAFIGYLLHELGFFAKIKIARDKIPKMTIAGVRFKGPYHSTGKSFMELEKKLSEAKINVQYCGLYFDGMDVAPAEQRSFVAAIINDPNEETLNKLKELELEVIEIEEQNEGLHAYYPLTSLKFLEGFSFMTAPMKVYPAMTKYLEQNEEISKSNYDKSKYEGKNIPCFEIYDREASRIHFILHRYNQVQSALILCRKTRRHSLKSSRNS